MAIASLLGGLMTFLRRAECREASRRSEKVIARLKYLETQAHHQRDEDDAFAIRPDADVAGACRGRAPCSTEAGRRYDPALPPKRDNWSGLAEGEQIAFLKVPTHRDRQGQTAPEG